MPVRLVKLLVCLLLAAPATAARPELPTLNPAQAIGRAAAASPRPVRALFQFRVQSAKKTADGYYLDSEKDFRSPANLGIAIRGSAMRGLTRRFGADLGRAFVGKTVKLIGQVKRIPVGGKRHPATATQVEVTLAGQILSVS
jgi:hypothetical protein